MEVGPKVSSKICVIIKWETSSETTVTSAAYCQKPPGDTFSTSPTKSLNCCYAATAAVEIRTTGTTRRYKEKLHSSTYSALTLFSPLFTVLWGFEPQHVSLGKTLNASCFRWQATTLHGRCALTSIQVYALQIYASLCYRFFNHYKNLKQHPRLFCSGVLCWNSCNRATTEL